MRKEVHGPKTLELIERHRKVLATTTHGADSVSVERGEGIYVWDIDGRKYIDCVSQVSIADVGQCHPKVVDAIRRQAGKLTACIGTDFYNTAQVEAAEKLAEITRKSFPDRDWRVYFCSSGGEANNAAIKLLLDRRPQRQKFISFLGAFHGRFGYALDVASSKSLHKKGYPEAIPAIHLPYPDCLHCAYEKTPHHCEELCIRIIEKEYLGRRCDPEEINGVIIEPIQGEGGFIVPNSAAIKRLRDLCSKYDWVLVDDEVQAGLGRTGKMFAVEHFGVEPDIICLAKKLGSGVPIGAIVFPADWDFTAPGRHSTTFGGGPLGWAAEKATLEVIEDENLVARAAENGAYFLEKLREIQERFNHDEKRAFANDFLDPLGPIDYIGDVRGLGLMIGVEFVSNEVWPQYFRGGGKPNPAFRDAVILECLKQGIIPLGAGHPQRNPTIRFSPPLIVTKTDIDKIANKFEKALKAATKRPQ